MAMTTLVQILLPLFDNDGKSFERSVYDGLREELTRRFGGLTAYTRAPAVGLWQSAQGEARDDIVIFEVMVEELDALWWRCLRTRLEGAFRQDRIIVRAQPLVLL